MNEYVQHSKKYCCCGGHNSKNIKKNKNHNSTKSKLSIKENRKFKLNTNNIIIINGPLCGKCIYDSVETLKCSNKDSYNYNKFTVLVESCSNYTKE